MRWLLLIGLSGCDHFELEARVTVRDGHGQLQLERRPAEVYESHGFFDLAEAIEEPARFGVMLGGRELELPLRVDGCRHSAVRVVSRATVDYELFHADGALQLQPIGGSCISAEGTAGFVVAAP